jgi:23S rRNA pseudouridine1911/1915/1917 synthase
VSVGDVIDIAASVEPSPIPGYIEPRLLHVDEDLVVADKPAGVLSQSAEHGRELSFDVMVLIQRGVQTGRRPFLRLFHRLDRVTSGTLLFAASPRATAPLHRAWQDGRVDRRYLALVEGHPRFIESTLDGCIDRDPDHAWRFMVASSGRPASTRVEVVARGATRGARWSLVSCALSSGRTHQIRVHLAAAGHPVAGDRLYGAHMSGLTERPLLHAHSVSLPHPRDGARLTVTAEPPPDLGRFLDDGCG